jgi:ribonucleoside-diphosphate reductase alpha chain
VEFADRSMEAISYFAIQASSDLAAERGRLLQLRGLAVEPGHLPIDSCRMLQEERGEHYLQVDRDQTLDWDAVREKVKEPGHAQLQRDGHCPHGDHCQHHRGVPVHRAHLPEPLREIEPVRRIHRGEPLPGRDLKAAGLWDKVMVNDLKYYDGSLQEIDRMPEDLKALYATAFEVEPRWLVEAASSRARSGSTRPSP